MRENSKFLKIPSCRDIIKLNLYLYIKKKYSFQSM